MKMRSKRLMSLALLMAASLTAAGAAAKVQINIDLAAQQLTATAHRDEAVIAGATTARACATPSKLRIENRGARPLRQVFVSAPGAGGVAPEAGAGVCAEAGLFC